MSNLTDKLVTFRLGDDHFAADVHAVERVLRYTVPTSVPDMPEYIEGVMDYLGRVVPVVNLRRRFELPRKVLPPTNILCTQRKPRCRRSSATRAAVSDSRR